MSTVEYDRLIRIRILFEKQAAIVFEIYGVEGEDYRTRLKPAFADVDKAVKELGDLINIRIAVGNMFPIGGSPPPFPKERRAAIAFEILQASCLDVPKSIFDVPVFRRTARRE